MDRSKPATGPRGVRSPQSAIRTIRTGIRTPCPSHRPVRLAQAIGLLRRDPGLREPFEPIPWPHDDSEIAEAAGSIEADLEFRAWLVDEIFDPIVQQVIDETSPLDEAE